MYMFTSICAAVYVHVILELLMTVLYSALDTNKYKQVYNIVIHSGIHCIYLSIH